MEFLEKIKKILVDFFVGDPNSEEYIKKALEGKGEIPEIPTPSKFLCVDKDAQWFFSDEAVALYNEADAYEEKTVMLASYLHKIADNIHNKYLIEIAFILVNFAKRLNVDYRTLLDKESKVGYSLNEYMGSDIEGENYTPAIRALCARLVHALHSGVLEKTDEDFVRNSSIYTYNEMSIWDPQKFIFENKNEDLEFLQMTVLLLAEAVETRSYDELIEVFQYRIGGGYGE